MPRWRATLFILFSLFALVGLLPLGLEGSENAPAQAFSFRVLCGDKLGHQMDQDPWSGVIFKKNAAEEASSRRMTAEEAFGSSMWFIMYHGETDPDGSDPLTSKEERTDGETIDVLNDNGAYKDAGLERVYNNRSAGLCLNSLIAAPVANGLFSIAKNFTALVSATASMAFSSGLICDEASSTTDNNCVDLLFIIGGDGSNAEQGLVGNLTDSIYLPLLGLVALLVAVWVFWRGIVQRKLRESLWGVIWALLSVIVGLAFLLNPALIAKGPAVFSNTIAGCVISAFGGNSCTGGNVDDLNTGTASSQEICVADATGNGAVDQRMELITSSLTCSIWRAFVLEPYSYASWGTSFNNLDTRDNTRGARLVENAGRQGNEFCVSLTTTETLKSQVGNTLKLNNGPRVCNLALYQMFLGTEAESTDGGGQRDTYQGAMSSDRVIDKRWYKLVDVASTNEAAWGYWSGDGGDRVAPAATAAITAVVGGVVILIISLFAMVFFFAAVFLTALAPLFFLIGVHPGKGRDILKGYAEMILSNVFKYIASALFLVVSLALYAGVLGVSSSPDVTLILVIILSIALAMYRKEIVNLIGTVNMGGTKMGQATTDRIANIAKDKRKDASRLATATVGTAVGAKMAGGSMKDGMAEGFSRELKRPGGLLGNVGAGVSRGFDLAGQENKRKLTEKSSQLAAAAREDAAVADEAEKDFNGTKDEYNKVAEKLNEQNSELERLREALSGENSKDNVLDAMREGRGLPPVLAADGKKFADAMKLQEQVDGLDALIARDPNGPRADELRAKRAEIDTRRDGLVRGMQSSGTYEDLQAHFDANHTEKVREFNQTLAEREQSAARLSDLRGEVQGKMNTLVDAKSASQASQSYADAFDREVKSIRQGKAVTAGDMEEVESKAKEASGSHTTAQRAVDIADLSAGLVETNDARYGQAPSPASMPIPTGPVGRFADTDQLLDPSFGGLPTGTPRPESAPVKENPVTQPLHLTQEETLFSMDEAQPRRSTGIPTAPIGEQEAVPVTPPPTSAPRQERASEDAPKNEPEAKDDALTPPQSNSGRKETMEPEDVLDMLTTDEEEDESKPRGLPRFPPPGGGKPRRDEDS